MTKFHAKVPTVLRPGVHQLANLSDSGALIATKPFSDAEVVEIEVEPGGTGSCFLYRYSSQGEPCGDTWHATLADAFRQAHFEYGLNETDFQRTD